MPKEVERIRIVLISDEWIEFEHPYVLREKEIESVKGKDMKEVVKMGFKEICGYKKKHIARIQEIYTYGLQKGTIWQREK
jgi:hypothetical protein